MSLSGWLTRSTVHALDRVAAQVHRSDQGPPGHQTGARGEEEAYFYLRRLGYVMVARNFRSPRRRGEIDLIGWDREVLCFIEVKTRTSRDIKPAEAAVDRDKRRELREMAREYLRFLPTFGQWRFDVVSVYYQDQTRPPQIEVFKNAFSMS